MFLKNSMWQYVVLANLGIWHTEKFYHPFQHPPSDNRVVTDSPYECEIVTPAVPTLPAQTHLRYVPFSKYSSLYYPPY